MCPLCFTLYLYIVWYIFIINFYCFRECLPKQTKLRISQFIGTINEANKIILQTWKTNEEMLFPVFSVNCHSKNHANNRTKFSMELLQKMCINEYLWDNVWNHYNLDFDMWYGYNSFSNRLHCHITEVYAPFLSYSWPRKSLNIE